ncbi:MAG: hypothetical protein ABSD85_16360 [Acidimicrobiales bacterium]|jgi:hypothetical protein
MRLSQSQLEAAAGHLAYEMRMTAALYAWTLKFDNEGPADLKNACLEATLLHVRLLIEFLAGRPSTTGRKRHPADIEPHDFVREWKEAAVLDGYLDIADKYLVHMSLERVQAVRPHSWALERMIDALLFEFQRFANTAEGEGSRFAPTFRAALVEARHRRSHPPVAWPDLPSRPGIAAKVQIADRL